MMPISEPKILWFNLSGSFVTGLDLTCPIEVVACLDDGQDFDLIRHRSDVAFLSTECRTRRRIVAHDDATDSIVTSLRAEIQTALRAASKAHWLLACPRPSPALETLARETGLTLVAPQSDLCHWLNHKANFFKGRDHLGLPAPPGRWLAPSSIAYHELQSEFGTQFVLQTPRATTGAGTAVVGNATDLAHALRRLGADEIWCASYLGRLSLNLNALATSAGTVVSYPSVQLEGPLFQEIHQGKYCGNDFSATHSVEQIHIEAAFEQTERFGSWLTSLGYRGIFGVDFVVDEATGDLVAVDLNPRWQGSTLLENMASRKEKRLPLAAADLLHAAGLMTAWEVVNQADIFRQALSGSQLILYALLGEPLLVGHDVRPGIYRAGDDLTFEREALELSDCVKDQELLLGSAVVRPGITLDPGTRPARLFSRQACIDVTTGSVHRWVLPSVEAALSLFGLPSESQSK